MKKFISILWYSRAYYLSEVKFYLTRNVLWLLLALSALGLSPINRKMALSLAMLSSRSKSNGLANTIINKYITQIIDYFYPTRQKCSLAPQSLNKLTDRCLIVKYPSTGQKGIMFVKFSETVELLVQSGRLEQINRQYHMVIEPSWAGYALPQILSLASCADPIYIQAADSDDFSFIKQLKSNLIPVRTGSGDWVDNSIFKKLRDIEQIYDIVYVANFNPIKRVHRFLKTVRTVSVKNQTFRAALVCSSFGGNRKAFMNLLDAYSPIPLDYYEDLNAQQLNKVFNQSRLNCLFSLKEGSNRTLFEGMAAGVKAVLLTKNIGVNRENIIQGCGMVMSEARLEDILASGTADPSCDIAKWAQENISAEATLKKILETINSREQTSFTNADVRNKVNRPEACYIYEDDQYNHQLNKTMIMELFSS